jgi:putative hydrolase of the HAD superfamily
MSPVAEVRAVTFDAGGTLIQPWPSVGHVYAEIAARHGHKFPGALLDQRFAKAWRGLKNFNHGRDEWAALVDQTFSGLLEPLPSATFFSELYDRFAEPDVWRIFDDAKPALDALAARGIALAIISNWDERLRPLLDKLKLAKYFDTIVISAEIGFPKPSPVIFEHTAKKLGLAPEFILHVGDSCEHDKDGAVASGYQYRVIDRQLEDPREGHIKSLAELWEV